MGSSPNDSNLEARRDQDEIKAGRASDTASVIAICSLFANFVSMWITLGAIISSCDSRTRVTDPNGAVNTYKIAISKGFIDPFGFIILAITAKVTSMKGGFWNIFIFTLFGLANMALSALTFVAFAQDGVNGIVGLKQNDPSLYTFKGRYSDNVSGEGLYYFNTPAARNAVIGSWFTSGITEGILGPIYVIIALYLAKNKWFSRKN